MKKLLLGLTLGMLLVSCSQDDSLNNPISNEVCECDRVVEATTFNVVGTPQNPTLNYYTTYTTFAY